jgi:hypothetical protein
MLGLYAVRMRTRLIALFVLVLLAAAINMPVAHWCSRQPAAGARGVTLVNEIGPEASKYSWPARGPHAQAWPPLHQYSVSLLGFGAVRIDGWAQAAGTNTTSHQMQSQFYGWPIASLEHSRFWWPWNDPAWASTASPDTGMKLRWRGVLLNPLILGGSTWVLLFGAPWGFRRLRAWRRSARGQCRACGYPRTGSGVCPECGGTVAAPSGATLPAASADLAAAAIEPPAADRLGPASRQA